MWTLDSIKILAKYNNAGEKTSHELLVQLMALGVNEMLAWEQN